MHLHNFSCSYAGNDRYKLIQGLINQFYEEGKERKVANFVKPRSARTERELESFDLNTLKQAHRIKGLLRRKKKKALTTSKTKK